MRSAYATIILARLRRQELLDTLPKKNYKYKNTTKQNVTSHLQPDQKQFWNSIWKQHKGSEPFTPHILLLMFNLHANQILPLRSGDKSELILQSSIFEQVNGRYCICHRHVSSSQGKGIASHSFKKQQSINSPPKPISPVTHNQIQCSEKQSGSNKCETSTSKDSDELEAHGRRGDWEAIWPENAPEKRTWDRSRNYNSQKCRLHSSRHD